MNNYDYIIDAFTLDGSNVNEEIDNLTVGCITSKDNNFELDSSGNLTVNSITFNESGNITRQIMLDFIYPVGSIYMSVNGTDPSILFGGTWTAWGTGRVPVGIDSSDTDFNTVEKLSGNKSISYTPQGTNTGGAVQSHALIVEELPPHQHGSYGWADVTDGSGTYRVLGAAGTEPYYTRVTGSGWGHSHGFINPSFYGTVANLNVQQKSITCYMWKRTA